MISPEANPMSLPSNRRQSILVAMIMSSVLATGPAVGCATDHPSQPASAIAGNILPDPAESTFQWLPTTALDLSSSDGTFVRAIIESGRLYLLYRKTGLTAPGYFGAAQRIWPANAIVLRRSRAFQGPLQLFAVNFPNRVYNFRPRHVPFPAPQASSRIGRAAVCVITGGSPPKTRLWDLFTYERSGNPPPSRQQGSSNLSRTNVFGDWKAVEQFETIWQNDICSNPPTQPEPDASSNTPSPGWPDAHP